MRSLSQSTPKRHVMGIRIVAAWQSEVCDKGILYILICCCVMQGVVWAPLGTGCSRPMLLNRAPILGCFITSAAVICFGRRGWRWAGTPEAPCDPRPSAKQMTISCASPLLLLLSLLLLRQLLGHRHLSLERSGQQPWSRRRQLDRPPPRAFPPSP